MRLLLISTSSVFGSGYLDYCAEAITTFLGPSASRVTFIPYAVHDCDAYAATAQARFEELGLALDSVHAHPRGPVEAVHEAAAVFIGGGNTFRLIDALWRLGLVEAIRARVLAGMPYLGSSAGANVACPTIKTTNDMPIVQPPSFEALGLVPFQINPHYLDALPGSTHMGETREERIDEFHEENEAPVVALREGSWLAVDGAAVRLEGTAGARLFRRGQPALEVAPGSRMDQLM
jgi:dipeptidase E